MSLVMEKCPYCGDVGTIAIVSQDSTQYCTSCQSVMEDKLSSEIDFYNDSGGRSHCSMVDTSELNTFSEISYQDRNRQNYQEQAKRATFLFVERFLGQIGLGNALELQVKNLIRTYRDGIYSTGRKAELEAACCAFIVARYHNKPLTLADIAKAVSCEHNKLGSIFRKVAKKLNYNEKADQHTSKPQFTHFIERACYNLDLKGNNKAVICELAEKLIKIAQNDSLLTGRRPTAIYGAAILLALEINGVKPMVNVKACATSLKIGESTIRCRVKELKQMLVKIGQSLPWGSSITEQNIVINALKILEFIELKQKLCNKTDNICDSSTLRDIIPTIKSSSSTSNMKSAPSIPQPESLHFTNQVSINSSPLKRKLTVDTNTKPTKRVFSLSNNLSEDSTKKIDIFESSASTTVNQDTENIQALPPSYRRAVKMRERRKEKIERAKKYLKSLLKDTKIRIDNLNTTNSIVNDDFMDFDYEDLLLQKLILAGTPDDELLYATPSTLQAMQSQRSELLPKHDLNSTELSELDISDAEVREMLKTQSEVEFILRIEKKYISEEFDKKLKSAKDKLKQPKKESNLSNKPDRLNIAPLVNIENINQKQIERDDLKIESQVEEEMATEEVEAFWKQLEDTNDEGFEEEGFEEDGDIGEESSYSQDAY